MTLIIPYTFVAGTKAQSAQVNENFQAVATEVNSIGSDLADAETAITNLTNSKADVNGNTSNRFAVADPVNGNDAVNKQYFNSLAQYLLAGLVISKADDEYISCTAGACYDTTGAKILRFASDVSKSEYPYNINATYYVYIVGMPAGGTNTQLLISTSSSSPALPSGYTLYRGLGNFTTDSSGKIKEVYGYSYATTSDVLTTQNNTIGFPDLSSGVSKTFDILYTAEDNGWVQFHGYSVEWQHRYLSVNGVVVYDWEVNDANGEDDFWFPLKAGDTYKAYGTVNSGYVLKFYTMR